MKMKMLNLNGKENRGSRRVKAWQVILGIVALVMVPSLGNTFAGSITVNTNGKVEFGQGITAAAACDSDGVTITPSAKYDTPTAAFYLESVTVTNIDFSNSSTKCLGKTFKLSVIDSTGATVNWAGSSYFGATIDSTTANNAPTNKTPSSNFTINSGGGTSTTGTLYFQYTGAIASGMAANLVDKIIIQTQ